LVFSGLGGLNGRLVVEHAARLCSGWGMAQLGQSGVRAARDDFLEQFGTYPEIDPAKAIGLGITNVVIAMAPRGDVSCWLFQLSDQGATAQAEAYQADSRSTAIFHADTLT